MKFRFYITDTFNGQVVGTNDATQAENHALMSEYFVVDTETGEWLDEDGVRREIKESPSYSAS